MELLTKYPPFALRKTSGANFLSTLAWGAAVWELPLMEDRTGVSAANPQLVHKSVAVPKSFAIINTRSSVAKMF